MTSSTQDMDQRRQRVNCLLDSHRRYAAGGEEAIGTAVRDLLTVAMAERLDVGALYQRLLLEVPGLGLATLAKPAPIRETRHKEAGDLDQGNLIWVGSADGFVEVSSVEDAGPGMLKVATLVTHSDESVVERELVVPACFDFVAQEGQA